MLTIKCDPEYMGRVRAFAQLRGLANQLQEQLDYLDRYACGKAGDPDDDRDPDATRCLLFKDFAPHSFEFVMERKLGTREFTCACGNKFRALVKHGPTPNISGEVSTYCPICGAKAAFASPMEYARWFNGGLIYYGKGDSGVGEPQLSVRIGDTSEGWSIHT